MTAKLIHSRRLVKSYPRLWFAGFASRPSCYACSFKEEDRVSDFTLFDSFKSAGQYGFKDDDMGLVFAAQHVSFYAEKSVDKSMFKYQIEYQPGFAFYDMSSWMQKQMSVIKQNVQTSRSMCLLSRHAT